MVKTKGINVLIFAAIRTLGRRSIRHMRNCFHRPPRTRYLSRNRRDGVPFAPQRQRKVQNRPSGPTLPSLKRLPASFSGLARLMFSKGNKSPCSASTGAMACAILIFMPLLVIPFIMLFPLGCLVTFRDRFKSISHSFFKKS